MYKGSKLSLKSPQNQIPLQDDQAVYIELQTDFKRTPYSSHKKSRWDLEDNEGPQLNDISEESETAGEKQTRSLTARYCVFLTCIFVLFIGRYSVPENDVTCVVDKIMDAMEGINRYILAHPFLRDTLMIICSGFMDFMFLTTFLYWVYCGKSSRLIITTAMFYLIRAAVQAIWYSPFPAEGYWWYDPGFPSLVVPYGRGSDFFFSGHIGFVVICANEWKKNNKPQMVNFITIGGIYTAFMLIAYRIHYSIDVIAGIIVAHWCFMLIDQNKEHIDAIFGMVKSGVYSYKGQDSEKGIVKPFLNEYNCNYSKERERI